MTLTTSKKKNKVHYSFKVIKAVKLYPKKECVKPVQAVIGVQAAVYGGVGGVWRSH